MLRKALFAASIAMLLAGTATAATITYTLDLTGAPGTFTLKAATSGGDNAGLAVYGVPLSGTVLTLDNFSPQMSFGTKGAFNGPAGYGSVRSADIISSTLNPVVTGSQDTVNAAAPNNLVFGIGQTAGSFATTGWTPIVAGTDAQAWVAPVILATGTYTGTLGFNTQSVNLVGNAFASNTSSSAPAATIATQVLTGGTIPEPATVSLLGLAMVGGLGVIRRRRVA